MLCEGAAAHFLDASSSLSHKSRRGEEGERGRTSEDMDITTRGQKIQNTEQEHQGKKLVQDFKARAKKK